MTTAKKKLVALPSPKQPVGTDIRELGSVRDADRIQRLRDAIAENRLRIDVDAIASAIVEDE